MKTPNTSGVAFKQILKKSYQKPSRTPLELQGFDDRTSNRELFDVTAKKLVGRDSHSSHETKPGCYHFSKNDMTFIVIDRNQKMNKNKTRCSLKVSKTQFKKNHVDQIRCKRPWEDPMPRSWPTAKPARARRIPCAAFPERFAGRWWNLKDPQNMVQMAWNQLTVWNNIFEMARTNKWLAQLLERTVKPVITSKDFNFKAFTERSTELCNLILNFLVVKWLNNWSASRTTSAKWKSDFCAVTGRDFSDTWNSLWAGYVAPGRWGEVSTFMTKLGPVLITQGTIWEQRGHHLNMFEHIWWFCLTFVEHRIWPCQALLDPQRQIHVVFFSGVLNIGLTMSRFRSWCSSRQNSFFRRSLAITRMVCGPWASKPRSPTTRSSTRRRRNRSAGEFALVTYAAHCRFCSSSEVHEWVHV